MKTIETIARFGIFLTVIVLLVQGSGETALAGEKSGDWRSTYDLVMMWVNFAILAGVLVKFTATPIKDFLRDRKEQLSREIKRAEREKEKAEEKIREAVSALEQSEARFATIRQRIIDQGEREKQKIIQNAQRESKLMLEGAKRKIDSRIKQSKDVIRSELVDEAVLLAFKKLPETITAEDDQKFIDLYLSNTAWK